MKKIIIAAIAVFCGCVADLSAKTFEATVEVPGTLARYIEAVPAAERRDIDKMVLHGKLNSNDCACIRAMCGNDYNQARTRGKVKSLDLRDVEFVPDLDRNTSKNREALQETFYLKYIGLHRIEYGVKSNEIPSFLFRNCTIEEIVLPSNITRIGTGAFEFTNLKRIVIPKSVTRIEAYAFNFCWDMEEIVIEGDLERVGTYAFTHMEKLKTLTFNSARGICENIIDNCDALQEVVFKGEVSLAGVPIINKCRSLTSVKMEKGIKGGRNNRDNLFRECPRLERLTINADGHPDGKYEYELY